MPQPANNSLCFFIQEPEHNEVTCLCCCHMESDLSDRCRPKLRQQVIRLTLNPGNTLQQAMDKLGITGCKINENSGNSTSKLP